DDRELAPLPAFLRLGFDLLSAHPMLECGDRELHVASARMIFGFRRRIRAVVTRDAHRIPAVSAKAQRPEQATRGDRARDFGIRGAVFDLDGVLFLERAPEL